MFLDGAADGARWVLVIVFALAAIEKASTLRSRSATWHPVILVSARRRRHGVLLIAASLIADALALGLLVSAPLVGAVFGAALIAGYSIAARTVHLATSEERCSCFWKGINTSTKLGLMIRNLFLFVLAGLVTVLPPAPTPTGLLWAAGMLTVLFVLARAADRSGSGARVGAPMNEAVARDQHSMAALRLKHDPQSIDATGGVGGW